jgi:hypothetical protein
MAYSQDCPHRENVAVIGVAKTVDTGEFLYCEYHTFLSQDRTTVDYYDKHQSPIAIKKIDYTDSRLSPSIEQDDFRHEETIRVKWVPVESNAPSDEARLLVQYQAANTEELGQKWIAEPASVVVDAGFDHAIRFYWQQLEENGHVTFTFVAPAQLRTIKLRVVKRDLMSCLSEGEETVDYQKNTHICYVVKPSSSLLSWFVKPIKLIYHRKSQRLMVFSGNSNISNIQGRGQQARITYRYF